MKFDSFFLILLITLFSLTTGTNAQNHDSNKHAWEYVNLLVEKNLPESALNTLDSIGRATDLNLDKQELIKVKLYQYRIQTEKNPDTAPSILKEFEQFAHAFEPSAEKQLLYCMAAKMYHNYYQSKQSEIDR